MVGGWLIGRIQSDTYINLPAFSRRRLAARQIGRKEQRTESLSIVHPFAVRWLGTALDGQTDKLKLTEFVCPSSTVRGPLTRNGA
jgi:hypothetical protein